MVAGQYQIVVRTWNGLARQLGLTDFSPHSQDLAAAWLLKETGAVYQLMQDNPIGAISLAATRWEALPHSVHPSGAFGLSYAHKSLRPSFEYLRADYYRRLVYESNL